MDVWARIGDGRAVAVALVLVGLVLAVKLPEVAAAGAYLGVLAVALLVLCVAAAARVLFYNRYLCRSFACGIVVLVAAGQLLNASVGLPGGSALHGPVGAWGALALIAEAFVLVAVVGSGTRSYRDEPAYAPGHGNHRARG